LLVNAGVVGFSGSLLLFVLFYEVELSVDCHLGGTPACMKFLIYTAFLDSGSILGLNLAQWFLYL